ncbi:MAG TPA: hypothetical protein PLO44_01555 [Candidatus Paceibacterota bacterium]|nr:hypothetical protein [Candidatus Paceibacterota bacterium]
MLEIKDLLNRFSKIILSGEAKKQAIKEALYEAAGILVDTKDISIKNNIVFLNIKPLYKNEIFLKKEKIFSVLKNKIGEVRIPEDFK